MRYLSRQQVAEMFGVHPNTVDNWRADPSMGLPAPIDLSRPGAQRPMPRWPEDDLERWAKRQKKVPA